MDFDSQFISNPEIKSTLLTIYDKIGMTPTREVGYELFLDLILNNIYSSSTIIFIISQVGDFINSLNPKEKEPYLKLLSIIFYNPNNQQDEEEENDVNSKLNKDIYYIYLSPVLNILQLVIKEPNSDLFPTIANIYAEIVQNVMPTDISASTRKLNMEENKAYEILQGFCIYNIKYDDKSNRIVGSLCLTKLVENCPIVLQSQYTKFIWDNIINFIDKKYFNAKVELLNCLISLILGTENLFCPYANVTLYKVLDFLTDNDWLKRKLALNVIYTLIFYCKEEILPLKDHIINFLKVLKTDKVKEVREVCLLILQIFSENEPKNEKKPENYSVFSSQKNNKEVKKPNKDFNSKRNKTQKLKTNNLIKNNYDNTDDDNEKLVNSFHNSEKKSKNNDNNDQLGFADNKERERDRDRDRENNRSKTPVGRKRSTEEEGNSNLNNNINHNKFVNRKDDHTFINEKMKIRPDPNKSIFKTNPNSAFFNQAKNAKNDIIVMAKGDPSKYNYNNENKVNSAINVNPSVNSSNQNDYLNKTQPNIKNINLSDNIDNNINNESMKNKKYNKNTIEINDNKYDYEKEKIKKGIIDIQYQSEVRTKYNKNKDRGNKKVVKEKKEVNNKINTNNQKEKNNNDFYNIGVVNNNKKVDSILVNKLLSQMNNLSVKQLSLIDVMENIQTDAQKQIQSLNEKIFSLDSLVDELTEELNQLKNENNY